MRVCLTTLPKNAYSMFLSYNTIQYIEMEDNKMKDNKMPGNKMQDNTMQDNTMQYNTMQGNADGFETVRKMGNDLEKSGWF